MENFQLKLAAFIEDVNQEDGYTLQLFAKLTTFMFSLIKWAGIPYVLYLLIEIWRW
jgi:hypothetical protein